MPDASGRFKGTGWTRSSAEAWDRVFGDRDQPPWKVTVNGQPFAGNVVSLATFERQLREQTA